MTTVIQTTFLNHLFGLKTNISIENYNNLVINNIGEKVKSNCLDFILICSTCLQGRPESRGAPRLGRENILK